MFSDNFNLEDTLPAIDVIGYALLKGFIHRFYVCVHVCRSEMLKWTVEWSKLKAKIY